MEVDKLYISGLGRLGSFVIQPEQTENKSESTELGMEPLSSRG